jgi:hypothetical protein
MIETNLCHRNFMPFQTNGTGDGVTANGKSGGFGGSLIS